MPSSRSSFGFLRVSIWESRSGVAVAMGASAGALFSAAGAGELAEAFMNDYCDFMEEYQAEGRPASMLAKYGEMMGKYADMAAKFDAIDEGLLSADDDAYYIQVQTRVNQRLLAVAAR